MFGQCLFCLWCGNKCNTVKIAGSIVLFGMLTIILRMCSRNNVSAQCKQFRWSHAEHIQRTLKFMTSYLWQDGKEKCRNQIGKTSLENLSLEIACWLPLLRLMYARLSSASHWAGTRTKRIFLLLNKKKTFWDAVFVFYTLPCPALPWLLVDR